MFPKPAGDEAKWRMGPLTENGSHETDQTKEEDETVVTTARHENCRVGQDRGREAGDDEKRVGRVDEQTQIVGFASPPFVELNVTPQANHVEQTGPLARVGQQGLRVALELGGIEPVEILALDLAEKGNDPSGRQEEKHSEEDDGEPFAEKMVRLTTQLKTQFEESDRLEAEIKKNLAGLGYDV